MANRGIEAIQRARAADPDGWLARVQEANRRSWATNPERRANLARARERARIRNTRVIPWPLVDALRVLGCTWAQVAILVRMPEDCLSGCARRRRKRGEGIG